MQKKSIDFEYKGVGIISAKRNLKSSFYKRYFENESELKYILAALYSPFLDSYLNEVDLKYHLIKSPKELDKKLLNYLEGFEIFKMTFCKRVYFIVFNTKFEFDEFSSFMQNLAYEFEQDSVIISKDAKNFEMICTTPFKFAHFCPAILGPNEYFVIGCNAISYPAILNFNEYYFTRGQTMLARQIDDFITQDGLIDTSALEDRIIFDYHNDDMFSSIRTRSNIFEEKQRWQKAIAFKNKKIRQVSERKEKREQRLKISSKA